MSQITVVKKVAEVAKQTGHGVTHPSNIPAQQKRNVEQAAQHNRDMERIQRLHERGLKK
jgi:hypothetical protein